MMFFGPKEKLDNWNLYVKTEWEEGMKKVIVLIGPNGVGKTTTARAIIDLKSRNAIIKST